LFQLALVFVSPLLSAETCFPDARTRVFSDGMATVGIFLGHTEWGQISLEVLEKKMNQMKLRRLGRQEEIDILKSKLSASSEKLLGLLDVRVYQGESQEGKPIQVILFNSENRINSPVRRSADVISRAEYGMKLLDEIGKQSDLLIYSGHSNYGDGVALTNNWFQDQNGEQKTVGFNDRKKTYNKSDYYKTVRTGENAIVAHIGCTTQRYYGTELAKALRCQKSPTLLLTTSRISWGPEMDKWILELLQFVRKGGSDDKMFSRFRSCETWKHRRKQPAVVIEKVGH